MPRLYLNTGQSFCYATDGGETDCAGSGQDGEEAPGIPWPEPRFHVAGDTIRDCLTDLEWTVRANFTEFPLDWLKSVNTVRRMNRDRYAGHRDWRLPNRRELRSLISYQTRDRDRHASNHPGPGLSDRACWKDPAAFDGPG